RRVGGRLQQRRGVRRPLHRERAEEDRDRQERGPGRRSAPRPGIRRMSAVTQIIVWLNVAANAVGWLLTPIAWVPGWLSATLVSAVTGVLLLAVFKYTSAQKAIKHVRAGIDANLLTLKLFKDSVTVALRAQAGLFAGAVRLFVLGLVPLAVMTIPVALFL